MFGGRGALDWLRKGLGEPCPSLRVVEVDQQAHVGHQSVARPVRGVEVRDGTRKRAAQRVDLVGQRRVEGQRYEPDGVLVAFEDRADPACSSNVNLLSEMAVP